MRDDFATVNARCGAEVDDVIGGHDRVFVVLNNDHCVAKIAQTFEHFQQPIIVALMQADRGLVEHVHDARQARADLRSKPDALCFAAG